MDHSVRRRAIRPDVRRRSPNAVGADVGAPLPTALVRAQHAVGNRAVTAALRSGARAGTEVVTVQRWESDEHVALGDNPSGPRSDLVLLDAHRTDLPQRASPPARWPARWRRAYERGSRTQRRMLTRGLTYGEIVALSGDFYTDWAALNRAPLREIYDLIPLIRKKHPSTAELERASGGRYLAMAKKNESHFTNVRKGHRNIDVWWRTHAAAISAARTGDRNSAWGQNAVADHFLTDAFSGGHIRVARTRLMAKGNLGNIDSKVLHDLDNEHGVWVTNGRGDRWIAYGDDFLRDPRNVVNKAMAEAAVARSRQDVADALARGKKYPVPVSGTAFAAQELIPRPVPGAPRRWKAIDYRTAVADLAVKEGPGMVAAIWKDDNRVRAWIRRQSSAEIGRQSRADRLRLTRVLLSGPTLDDDERAILKVLRASAAAGDLVAIVDQLNAKNVMADFHGAEEGQLRALFRRSYYGRTDVANALNLVVACVDGWTSEWEEEMIADLVECTTDPTRLIRFVGLHYGGRGSGYRKGLRVLDGQVDGKEQRTLDRVTGR